MVGNAMYCADGGKVAWERGVVGPLWLSTVEALVQAERTQASTTAHGRKRQIENEKSKKCI